VLRTKENFEEITANGRPTKVQRGTWTNRM